MKRVLIVEDDRFLAAAYKAKLSHIKNIIVDIALDGKQALNKIITNKPDGMILDLILPEMDGFELLRSLKDKNINIPTLISSNLDTDKDKEKAMALGIKGYFVKSNSSIKDIVNKLELIIK